MFAPQNRPHALRPARQICIWLLALAMAFQSVSAAVIGVTGVQHRHIACAQAEAQAEAASEPEAAEPAEGFFKALVHQLLGDGAMAILEARQPLAHAASASPPAANSFPVVWTGGIPDDLLAHNADASAAPQPAQQPLPPAPEVQATAACHKHPVHAHSGFQRHVHTHTQHGDDAPTVNIGRADGGGGDDASLMHAELPLGLEATPLSLQLTFITADRQPWPVHQQARPRSWRPAPQERPPRA